MPTRNVTWVAPFNIIGFGITVFRFERDKRESTENPTVSRSEVNNEYHRNV